MSTKAQLISLKQQAGFSLMEFLLVVAIITILTAIGTPLYISLQNSNGLDVTVSTLVQDLYQAQIFSRSEEHSSAWGVAVVGQTVVLYAGSSYATRNTAYDNTFTMPVTMITSGISEVDFTSLYGLPQTTGTFTIKTASLSRNVTINAKGMVDY